MNFLGEGCCLFCAVAETHSCQHVALGCDADSSAASHAALALDFFPKFSFRSLDLLAFGVAVNLVLDCLDFLQFKVYDVVHYALCL